MGYSPEGLGAELVKGALGRMMRLLDLEIGFMERAAKVRLEKDDSKRWLICYL